MLVLLENHLNYLKNNIFQYFLKKYNKLLLFKKTKKIFIIYNHEKAKARRRHT